MHRPSQISVHRSARGLARRAFSGSADVVRRRGNHIVIVAEAIRQRWGMGPRDWQAKHIRWFFQVHKVDCSSGTKYRYFLCIKTVLIYMDKWSDWKNSLNGSWVKPK